MLFSRALWNEIVSDTFHGRDVMAPVGARLATGVAIGEVGSPARATMPPLGYRSSPEATEGQVLMADRFGNLITNIPRSELARVGPPDRLRIRIGAAFIDGLVPTFSAVPAGMALAYVGSGEHLEIAVNRGRASEVLHLGPGSSIRVERRPR